MYQSHYVRFKSATLELPSEFHCFPLPITIWIDLVVSQTETERLFYGSTTIGYLQTLVNNTIYYLTSLIISSQDRTCSGHKIKIQSPYNTFDNATFSIFYLSISDYRESRGKNVEIHTKRNAIYYE